MIDPAEEWLARKYLSLDDFYHFSQNPILWRNTLKSTLLQEVRDLVVRSGQKSPPFIPERVFPYRAILEAIPDIQMEEREASLVPTADGFIIKYFPNFPRTKIRLTLAHEIGHTFFFEIQRRPPSRPYNYWYSCCGVEENYAFDVAREVLLPEPFFSGAARRLSKHLSVKTVAALQRDFNVSYEVIARRLLYDAHNYNKAFWHDMPWEGIIAEGVVRGTEPKLKVWRSPRFRKILRNISLIQEIREIVSHLEGRERYYSAFFKVGTMAYTCEGLLIPSRLQQEEERLRILLVCRLNEGDNVKKSNGVNYQQQTLCNYCDECR